MLDLLSVTVAALSQKWRLEKWLLLANGATTYLAKNIWKMFRLSRWYKREKIVSFDSQKEKYKELVLSFGWFWQNLQKIFFFVSRLSIFFIIISWNYETQNVLNLDQNSCGWSLVSLCSFQWGYDLLLIAFAVHMINNDFVKTKISKSIKTFFVKRNKWRCQ